MSTLVTANISDGTTTVGTEYVVQGSAKAWCSWKSTSVDETFGSFNISSRTDVATGQTALNLSSAFAARDYAGSSDTLSQSTAATYRGGLNYYGCTASALDYRIGQSSGYIDLDYTAITVTGVLA